jgi:hypothetical protein
MGDVNDDTEWNDDIVEDLVPDKSALVVYSRDWTVETIVSQIKQKNIDLNPGFQRRNVWDDKRKSRLIESLVFGLPVPELVLAEDPEKPKSYIVIDGKQRLLTISGFLEPAKYPTWDKARIQGLKGAGTKLNNKAFSDLAESNESGPRRQILNADIRCTVLSGYQTTDVLYDIFNRLNTGSVPLSTQELRQSLSRGHFSDFLIQSTNTVLPLHRVLKLGGPDKRLRDAELLLRHLALKLRGNCYRGNLKVFLDETTQEFNLQWPALERKIRAEFTKFNRGLELLISILGPTKVGRKATAGEWEPRFNKVLFEAQAYYFSSLPKISPTPAQQKAFTNKLMRLCDDKDFRDSIETTTKTNDKYEQRFKAVRQLINDSFGKALKGVPVAKK